MYTGPPIHATVIRRVPRHVECEHCGTEYVYEMARTGMGGVMPDGVSDEATLYHRAQQVAWAWCEERMPDQAEAVPCPKCLRYQPHMTEAARDLRWGWLRGIGWKWLEGVPMVCLFAAVVAALAFDNPRLPLLLAGGISVVLLVGGLITLLAFRLAPCDPNRWSESFRAEQAAALACTRDEFDLAAVAGGPFAEELTTGREAEYEGVLFLWVLPEEIAEEAIVPLPLPDGREIDVELTAADYDGVFLDEDRVEDPGGGKYRICLRVFSVHRSAVATSYIEPS